MTRLKLPPWRLVLQRPSITGESPVWCERTARLYWVDVQQPALHRLDPQTGINESWIMPAWIGCLALGGGTADGSVLVGLRTGAYRFELATGALSLIAPAPYDRAGFFLMTASATVSAGSGSDRCAIPCCRKLARQARTKDSCGGWRVANSSPPASRLRCPTA